MSIFQYFGLDPFIPAASYRAGEGIFTIGRSAGTLRPCELSGNVSSVRHLRGLGAHQRSERASVADRRPCRRDCGGTGADRYLGAIGRAGAGGWCRVAVLRAATADGEEDWLRAGRAFLWAGDALCFSGGTKFARARALGERRPARRSTAAALAGRVSNGWRAFVIRIWSGDLWRRIPEVSVA